MPSVRRAVVTLAALLLLTPGAVAAQWTSHDGMVVADSFPPGGASSPGASPASRERARVADKAAFIAQYDDGERDSGYTVNVNTVELAMLFDGVGGVDVTLDAVEVCFSKVGAVSDIRFEVVVWDDDGPGGGPGTEIVNVAAQATGVTSGGTFSTHPLGLPLPDPDVYIGVRFHPVVYEDFFVCVDHDNPLQPGYLRTNESGSWQTVQTIFPSYRVLMFRAFLSTPGVVAESLIVPFYEVDTTSPTGTTSLFAVRNVSPTATDVTIDYFTRDGMMQSSSNVNLLPEEVESVNLRDVPGLAVDSDGFARGYVEIVTAGEPDGTPVLAGDFLQVDVGEDFATGEKVVRAFEDVCRTVSTRFFDFGESTQLGIWIPNPRGLGPGDPHSFVFTIYDEAGNLADGPWFTSTSLNALQLLASDFTSESFGSIVFDFTNSSGGYVFAESSAEGRFSVGIGSQCEAP